MTAAPVPVVVNPAAGGGEGTAAAERLRARAEALGVEVDIHLPTYTAATRAALAAGVGAERVVVAGGDGIAHLATNALAGTETALGIVPVGTGNDAAGALGIPGDLTTAIDLALTGPPTLIDTLRIDGGPGAADAGPPRRGLTIATVGFGVTVNERAERLRWPTGQWSYTVATVLEIPKVRPWRYELFVDGHRRSVDAMLLAVANTPRFGGGMQIAPDADPADGLLDLVIIGAAPRRDLLRLLPAARSGGHLRDPRVEVVRCQSVEIRLTDGEAAPVRADGESVGDLPIRVENDPTTLRVVAPTTAH